MCAARESSRPSFFAALFCLLPALWRQVRQRHRGPLWDTQSCGDVAAGRRRCLQTSTGKGRSQRSESRKGLERLLVIFGQPLVSYQVAQASRLSTMRLAHSGERADPQPAPAYSSASSPPSANSLKLSRSAMFSG